MDRIGAMRAVLEAADAGSLSAAGRQLGLPLATISRKVSDLEAYLKTQIFIRTSRRLTLTEAGRAYVDSCRRILEDLAEAERIASGEYAAPRGNLRVATPIVFGRLHVLPVISEFLSAYPNVDIQLIQSDRLIDFVEDHIDVAVRIGALPDSDRISSKVGEIRQVVCVSPDYLKRRAALNEPSDLIQHDCITFERLGDASSWSFQQGKKSIATPVHSRLVVNTAEAAIDAAIAGLGVTRVLSYQAARAIREGDLVVALREFESPPSPVNLLYPGRGRVPMKLRAFLDFAAPRLRKAL